jgi:hypothetical protein
VQAVPAHFKCDGWITANPDANSEITTRLLTDWPQTDRNREKCAIQLDERFRIYSPIEIDPRSTASEKPAQCTSEPVPQKAMQPRCGNDRDNGVLDEPQCQSVFSASVQLINQVKGLRVQRRRRANGLSEIQI